MSKKLLAILGVAFSLLFVLMGLLVLCGAMGGDTRYPSSAPFSYDTGYATFGGDFYTYVSNNAAEAADASYAAATNVMALCDLVKAVSGIFMMGVGFLAACHFGILIFKFTEEEKVDVEFDDADEVELLDEPAEMVEEPEATEETAEVSE